MQETRKVTVTINGKAFHFDQARLCPADFRNAVGADADSEIWQVVGRPDPEGELPKDDVQVVDCIEVKNGSRFRVVPPGTFGAPTGAPTLDTEIEELRAQGHSVEVHTDGAGKAIVLKQYQLPKGYAVQSTDLLVRIPPGYPHANPDMFWVEVGVVLSDGRIPRSADALEDHMGRKWRRFSYHINNRWHPGRDSLVIFLAFVHARLAKRE